MRNKHRYKWMTATSGHRVKIDVEIAPLIRRLWDMALTTCNSCQDNFGYVWVEFATADEAEAFLGFVVQNGDTELSNRAGQPFSIGPDEREKLITHYHAGADSWLIAADAGSFDHGGKLVVSISISIRFPREHLARVMAALSAQTADTIK